MATGTPTVGIEYPSGDGKPMAETWLHIRAIMWLHQALEDFFRDRPDAFIASDLQSEVERLKALLQKYCHANGNDS